MTACEQIRVHAVAVVVDCFSDLGSGKIQCFTVCNAVK